MNDIEYVERRYRKAYGGDLRYYHVAQKESDLMIGAQKDIRKQAEDGLAKLRTQIYDEIRLNPLFLTSFDPLPPRQGAPEVTERMYQAAQACGVGPMAAVAGAVALCLGRELRKISPCVIIENGGDVYMFGSSSRRAAIFAGESPLSMKVAVEIPPGEWGICTSARIGPSVSLGRADAAVVLSEDAALADAAATRLGNMIQRKEDIAGAVEKIVSISGVTGAVAVLGDVMGAAGRIELHKAGEIDG